MQLDEWLSKIGDAIELATAPLLARIQVLERTLQQHKSAFPQLVIDDGGNLLAVTDLEQKTLGRVRGRDADPVHIDIDGIVRRVTENIEPKAGPAGKDADPVDLDGLAQKAAALIPAPKDGRDAVVDLDALAVKAAALVPRPLDGKDAVVDLDALALKAAALVPVPKDGRDAVVDLDALALKAAALVPVPKDGRDAVVDLDALAVKAAALVPKPVDGKDAQVDLDTLAQKAAALIPTPKDGRDAVIDVDAIAVKAAALVPRPVDGKDGKDAVVDTKAVAELVIAEVNKAVSAIKPPKDGQDGRDGKDANLSDIQLLVDASVTKAIGEIPRPRDGQDGKDGKSIDELQVKTWVEERVEAAVSARPMPKDGAGISDVVLDRAGLLVLTFTDGRTKSVGPIVGKDGKDVDPHVIREAIAGEFDKFPKPKDGRDGFGFDDVEVEFDDRQKSVFLLFRKGTDEKRFRLPIPIDAGLYDLKSSYLKGHVVGRDGSCWMAIDDVPAGVIPDGKTELSRKHWRLAVKRGGEGKQGPRGPEGPRAKTHDWSGEEDER